MEINMEKFFDCHTHEVYNERKGFLIALDGIRGTDGGYSNSEVVDVAVKNGMIPVQYVISDIKEKLETDVIKFHPRRENYTLIDVARYIENYHPKAVIIDTLNQPYTSPEDYWKLLMKFPEIPFLLSHAGGFDILYFLQIAMFQKNAWIDFSSIQHTFGWCGENVVLPHVRNHIDYALQEERIYRKVLFGSDNMRGEPDVAIEALEQYKKYNSYNQIVKNNYKTFLKECGI